MKLGRKILFGVAFAGAVLILAVGILGSRACAAEAAVQTTTIVGKVLMPNGAVATGGTIVAAIAAPGSVDDLSSGEGERVAGRYAGTIGADGSVMALALVPNDVIVPAGTYYQVHFTVTSPIRTSWTEKWSVTTAPDPVDVGDVTRLDVAPGLVFNLNSLSDVTVSSPAANQLLIFNASTAQWENKAHPSGSVGLTFSASNGFCDAELLTVTGAAVGDVILVGIPSNPDDEWSFQAHVQSTNLVRIVGCCHDPLSGTCDVAGTFKATVIK